MKWIEKHINNYIITHFDCTIYETNQGGYMETVSVFDGLRFRLKLSPCILSQDSQGDYIKLSFHSKDEIFLVNALDEIVYKGEYESSKIELESHNQLPTAFSLTGTFWVTSKKSTIMGFAEFNSIGKSESWGLDADLKIKCFEIENEKWKSLANSINAQ